MADDRGCGPEPGPQADRPAPSPLASDGDAVVLAVDHDGLVTFASKSCQRLLGWHADELVGTPLTRIIPERHHEAHRVGFRRFLATGEFTLAAQPTKLPALHAIAGEIDVELELRRGTSADQAVVGTLRLQQKGHESDHSELARIVRQAIASDASLEQLLHDCVAAIALRHGWVAAAVWWVDPWLGRLRALAVWETTPGAHPNYRDATLRSLFHEGEGIPGEVWSSGTPAFHPKVLEEASLARGAAFTADGLRRGLFFPLIAAGQTVGVVELLGHDPAPFSIEDQETVWVLADELGRHVGDRLRQERQAMQHQRVQMALTAGQMGIWSYHFGTGLVTWDERLDELHGTDPGSYGGAFSDLADRIHPDDWDRFVAQIEQVLQSGERFEYQYRVVRSDGQTVWIQGAGSPVTDAEGRLQALTGVCFDVTERMKTEARLGEQARHLALAADVGRALVGGEPLVDRLGRTVESVVDRLDAAFARIWTVSSESDDLRLVASAGLYTHLDGEHGRIRVGEFKIGTIAATRQPHLTNDVVDDPLVHDREWARREGMVAFAGYPLVAGRQLVGVLALFAKKPLPSSTLSALSSIADTVALAILQANLLDELHVMIDESQARAVALQAALQDRAHVAEVLQSSLLPPSLPEVPGLLLAASYRPGIEEVGGDFYDFFPLHDGWAFMIGDVCGRGPEAARLTALARHSLRTALLLGLDPARALGALNEAILAEGADLRFCTALCGTIVHSGAAAFVELAIGGHPFPLLIAADGTVREVGESGHLLGIVAEPAHRNATIRLEHGESLVLYTDGVTEARGPDGLFGETRLQSLLSGLPDRSPAGIVAATDAELESFGDTTDDDVAVLVIGVA